GDHLRPVALALRVQVVEHELAAGLGLHGEPPPCSRFFLILLASRGACFHPRDPVRGWRMTRASGRRPVAPPVGERCAVPRTSLPVPPAPTDRGVAAGRKGWSSSARRSRRC